MTQQHTAARRQVGLESIAVEHGWGLYEAAFRLDHPDQDEELPEVPPQIWTAARVEAMETAAIEAKLVHDQNFICLAACELWKRWQPEVASQEMLLEPLLLGYESYEADLDVLATEHWMRFWEALRPALGEQVRATEVADELLWSTDVLLYNWAMDLGSAGNLAVEAEPDLGPRVVEVLGEVLAQFADEDEDWQFSMRVDQAAALYVSGAQEEGERQLQALIAERPRYAEAYLRLADLWAPLWSDDPEAMRRALALLEQAAAAPVDEPEEWELEQMMEELRVRLRELSHTDRPGVEVW